jgi:hydroxymethylbilane synthase
MKDVPTNLAKGLRQAAVLPRASPKDILVFNGDPVTVHQQLSLTEGEEISCLPFVIATSSVRRKAQWLHRYPHHQVENIRGNVNTRLRKVADSDWNGAIFAAAGLERIGLRPEHSIDLDWMLPAPSQGAIMVVCRESDEAAYTACQPLNDPVTAFCTKLEKDFLRTLMGGCTTPISAFAESTGGKVSFRGNISSTDGAQQVEVSATTDLYANSDLGVQMAAELLEHPTAQHILDTVKHARD